MRFLSQEPKAIECRPCGTKFPRRKMMIPFDIVLAHEEKWMYPDPKIQGKKASIGEAHDKVLLCQTFLYFESIPILQLLIPGNFSRRKIKSEGRAQKFNTNGARLQ